ncbi:type IV conjugative transfer system protein TraL [Pseudomonas aeruginosa]|uniref:type IV conjugative transfer system protein TraL n=1 Tax=Pseudomonas aeruginosa TaxID=287 RepID=UPI001E3BC5E6|nr:type IV conjugative transfer system protein TraL [Pseudomonas aeruginosa]MCC9289602.1 type IV conjugative transfer system protein TraL [Pseudomonas aeruginosa]UVN18850.1 F-type type IV secretion, inner-membrane component of translocation channel [Pseudomonas aeruginosa]
MSEPIEIPAYIEQPPHVMIWRLDEVMAIGIGLVAGVHLAQLILCTVVGLLLARIYRRFCENRPDAYLLHANYWHWGAIGRESVRSMANSYERDFV